MHFANHFAPDWGLDDLGLRQAPRPPRPHRSFGQFFGRRSHRPAAPAQRGFVYENEHLRHLEPEAQRRRPQEQWAPESQHRGHAMHPGLEALGRESRRPRREQSLHPSFRREPSRDRREPSLHPGFDRESLHPGFGRRSRHPQREQSLHPGFDRRSDHPDRGPSFHAGLGRESVHPRNHQQARSFGRPHARSDAGVHQRGRRVQFDERPHVHEFQQFDAADFGLGGLSLGDGADQRHRRHGMRQRHIFAQSELHIGRQAQRQRQHRQINDNLEAFLRDFPLHRQRRRQAEAGRQPQIPGHHSLNPFRMRGRRSHHGDARSAVPQNHGIMRDYIHFKSLGKGGMSTSINVVKSRYTGELFVQKSVPIAGAGWRMKRFRAEVGALVRIKKCGGSPHLNNIIGFEYSSPSSDAVLILGYCDMGSVFDYMKAASQSRAPISESMVWNILQGGGKALAFLHEGIVGDRQMPNWDPIAHLDIKPQNIFLSSTGGKHGHPRVVVADFGCAVKASDIVRGRENPTIQEVGTRDWYPPEGIGHTPFQYYGPMTDIWQLGATAHAVCRFLVKPDRKILACGVPCGREYSTLLNDSVSHLTAFVSRSRPLPRAIMLTADRAFTMACLRR